jgi:cysteine desulfurase / selenocysteine lyase
VIDAISYFYAHDNSNIHRGAHTLAARATDAYEHARQTIADFLGANGPDEIIYVRGCTEGVNLCANILAPGLSRGDEIVLTELEHHANIVPWQMVAERTGAVIRVVPIDDRGDVILEAYAKLLSPLTKVVSISHASNSLGTILPVELMTGMAKARGARVLVDGAQSVSHFPVDVRRIGCDFYVFSGHKIFGPTGIGAVYMTKEAQESLPPWQGGGNMIKDVTFARTIYSEPPAKFEAGTPNIADAIGLGAALDYVTALGRERIAAYEHELLHYATGRLTAIDGLRLIGTAREKVGVLSFVIDGLDPIEIGKALDREGIAVRAGHHCAQPSLRRYGVEATVRPSLAFYNTHGEIDRLAAAIANLASGR